MKIVYIFADRNVPITGCESGASIHLQEMCRALTQLGHEIVVVAGKGGDGDGSPAGISKVYSIMPELHWFRNRLRKARPCGERTCGGDSLLASSYNPVALSEDVIRYIWARFWDVDFYRKAERIVRCERPDVLYERYVMQSTAATKLARKFGLPLISEINASFTFEDQWWHRHTSIYKNLLRAAEIKHATYVDRFATISSQLRDYLVELGVPHNKVAIVPDGADPDRFRPNEGANALIRQRFGLSDKVVVGFVGSLRRFHDLETVLHGVKLAVGEAPNIRCFIVGDGPQRQFLEAMVDEYELRPHVIFAGHVPHDFVPDYISCMDIAVATFPATHNYSSPLKLFEYMAAGKAIVASRTGIDDALTGEEGMLVNAGDSEELARSIVLLAQNCELRIRLGERARERLVRQFTWKASAQQVIDLYHQIRDTSSFIRKPGSSVSR